MQLITHMKSSLGYDLDGPYDGSYSIVGISALNLTASDHATSICTRISLMQQWQRSNSRRWNRRIDKHLTESQSQRSKVIKIILRSWKSLTRVLRAVLLNIRSFWCETPSTQSMVWEEGIPPLASNTSIKFIPRSKWVEPWVCGKIINLVYSRLIDLKYDLQLPHMLYLRVRGRPIQYH
jgi:hypothetical protein